MTSGLTPAPFLTTRDPFGKTVQVEFGCPLLYEQPVNCQGLVPTYAAKVFKDCLVCSHSVSDRTFSRESVGMYFSKVPPEDVRKTVASGLFFGATVAPGVLAAWSRWLHTWDEKQAKRIRGNTWQWDSWETPGSEGAAEPQTSWEKAGQTWKTHQAWTARHSWGTDWPDHPAKAEKNTWEPDAVTTDAPAKAEKNAWEPDPWKTDAPAKAEKSAWEPGPWKTDAPA